MQESGMERGYQGLNYNHSAIPAHSNLVSPENCSVGTPGEHGKALFKKQLANAVVQGM